MDENLITILDENGNEVLCEILFTFDSDEFNRSYILYVPVETKDDDDEVEVLCSAYIPKEDGSVGQLLPVEDDKEWEMVEEVFNTYMDSNFDEEDEDEHEHECSCEHDDEEHQCCCNHDDE